MMMSRLLGGYCLDVTNTVKPHSIQRVREMKPCNVVLEGGGVKGIGHVGAIRALEHAGYTFQNVAGSSAGAIVASLIAAGYSGDEMRELMKSVDYRKFIQKDCLDYFGSVGMALSILFHYGIYSAAYLERWLNHLLMEKHTACFRDVKRSDGTYRLQVTTVDLTTRELLVLPRDLHKFHIDIDSFSIAEAVRMSMSIPIFYEPYVLKDTHGVAHYMVDGGLLSNYPIWILDDGKEIAKYPTFGLKFVSDTKHHCKRLKAPKHFLDYAKQIVSTLLDAYDHVQISNSKGDRARSILIPSTVHVEKEDYLISTTDFDITQAEGAALFDNGEQAAKAFLSNWDFQKWLRMYRL